MRLELTPILSSRRPSFVMLMKPKDKVRADAALNFFRYALEKGQVEAGALSYLPLPARLVPQVETYLAKRD